MFYFETRSAARAFAAKSGRKAVDMAGNPTARKRWAVSLFRD